MGTERKNKSTRRTENKKIKKCARGSVINQEEKNLNKQMNRRA